MEHERTQLLNTVDGLRLADSAVRNSPGPRFVEFNADHLHRDMIACLQRGTIIHLNNQNNYILRFLREICDRVSKCPSF
jgi:hypothetical protein